MQAMYQLIFFFSLFKNFHENVSQGLKNVNIVSLVQIKKVITVKNRENHVQLTVTLSSVDDAPLSSSAYIFDGESRYVTSHTSET